MKRIILPEAFATFHFDERYLERVVGKRLPESLAQAIVNRVDMLKGLILPKGDFIISIFYFRKDQKHLTVIVRNYVMITTYFKEKVKSDGCFSVSDFMKFKKTLQYLRFSPEVPKKGSFYYKYDDYNAPFCILVKDRKLERAVSIEDVDNYPEYKPLN